MADKRKKGAKASDKSGKGAKASKGAPDGAGKPGKPPKVARGGGPKQSGPVSKERPSAPKQKPRLEILYFESVKPALIDKFKYKSSMQAPRLRKIVLNMGVGDALQDQKLLESAMNEMGQVAGQRPSLRRARKAISNFKLREGVPVGCSVTLRGARMYEFYDRLINIAVPRIRDFRGLSPRSFDGRGNYSMGLKEQTIFPEVPHEKVAKERGMDVTIVTSARTDEEGRELLRLMKMPFRAR